MYLPNLLIGSPVDRSLLEEDGFVLRKSTEHVYDILISPKDLQMKPIKNVVDGQGTAYLGPKRFEFWLLDVAGLEQGNLVFTIPKSENCLFIDAIQKKDVQWYFNYQMARQHSHAILGFGSHMWLANEYEWMQYRVF